MSKKVNNIPIEQDPETLEGQTQQFDANQMPTAPPENYVSPELEQAQQASQVPEVSKTDEILKRMYAVREKAPVLDTEKQARLQRMGKVNAIGKGVSLLSDALSLGLGGRVKKRGPDTMAPALFQQYQAMLDKYKNDQDNFDLREIANERNNIRMEYADEMHKQELKLKKELLEADTQAKKDAATLKFNQWVIEQQGKKAEREALAAFRKGMLANQHERNVISGKKKDAAEDKPFKPIEVYDDAGNKVKRSQADWTRDYLDAQTDPDYKTNLKALLSKYEKTPDGGLMQIANEYYNFKQKQRLAAKAASGNPDQPTYIYRPQDAGNIPATANQPVGTVTGPSKEEMAKNEQTAAKKKPAFFQ